MEIVDPRERDVHRHAWLEWLGLQQPPTQPDTWVPIARGFELDDARTKSSAEASDLVGLLSNAGIDAQQRSYEFDTTRAVSASSVAHGGMVTRVAVGVHNRDRARATEIATEFLHGLESQEQEFQRRFGISDEQLTRDALEAGRLPDERV